jgi:hypothetical protein
MTQEAFGAAMHAYLGQGWQREVVSRYERGKRTMDHRDFLAASRVLGCHVGELMTTQDRVSVGDRTIEPDEMAATVNGPSVDDRGWEAFEAAAQLLQDIKTASTRYVDLMAAVRARVARSPELRERIMQADQHFSDMLKASLDDTNWVEPWNDGRPAPWDMTSQAALNNNATPAMRAARDALESDPGFERVEFAWKGRRVPRGAGQEGGNT